MNRIILSIVAALSLGISAQAQDWVGSNRDDFGNIVRGAYLTNEWFDNWYIGVMGGVSLSTSKVNDPRVSPQFDINVIKWFNR